MSIRTFWTIFLKILGLWILIGTFVVIPQFLSTLFISGTNDASYILMTAAPLGVVVIVYLLILRLFLFKSGWLIDKLKLDHGFAEDKIDFNVQLSTILTVATIVIGGLLFVDALPILCKDIFVFYQQKKLFVESQSVGWLILDFARTVIGYMLITNSKLVVKFIDKQTVNKNEVKNDDEGTDEK